MSTMNKRGPISIWYANSISLGILRVPSIVIGAITGIVVALTVTSLEVQPSFASALAGCSVVVAGVVHTAVRMLLRYFGKESQVAVCVSIILSQVLVSAGFMAAASLTPVLGFGGGLIVGAAVSAAELIRVARSKAPVDLLPPTPLPKVKKTELVAQSSKSASTPSAAREVSAEAQEHQVA